MLQQRDDTHDRAEQFAFTANLIHELPNLHAIHQRARARGGERDERVDQDRAA